MRKKIKLTLFVFIFSVSIFTFAYESLQGQTEVLFWNKEDAFNGYTLFASGGKTFLMDMDGEVVNIWPIGTNPKLLENGNILDATKDDPSKFTGLAEIDWEGNVVWTYEEKRDDYSLHHDFIRIFNKELNEYTTLFIANKEFTAEECIDAGFNVNSKNFRGGQLDSIVEIDMDGNTIWEWNFYDHLIQDVFPEKNNYVKSGKTISDYPGKLDANLPGRTIKNDWLHCNSLDYNEALDQIVINSVQGEFYVIDHGNTFIPNDYEKSIELAAGQAGDFLYRFGDPARYQQGNPPSISEDWTNSSSGNKQIGGSHDIHWIDSGLPGEGNFLIFNNGQYLFDTTNQSYVYEINGFLNSEGSENENYINPPDAGYYKFTPNKDTHKSAKLISNQVVWSYGSKSNQGFFSHIGSSAQRLPNGNTLICSDTEGHFFEITSEGELVWEYINPITKEGTFKTLGDNYPMTNSVFRAYRFSYDFPAFIEKNLEPIGLITEISDTLKTLEKNKEKKEK